MTLWPQWPLGFSTCSGKPGRTHTAAEQRSAFCYIIYQQIIESAAVQVSFSRDTIHGLRARSKRKSRQEEGWRRYSHIHFIISDPCVSQLLLNHFEKFCYFTITQFKRLAFNYCFLLFNKQCANCAGLESGRSYLGLQFFCQALWFLCSGEHRSWILKNYMASWIICFLCFFWDFVELWNLMGIMC